MASATEECESETDIGCHFTWKPEEIDPEGDPKKTLDHLLQNLREAEDIALLSWPLVAYLHCKVNPPDYDSALESITIALQKCKELSTTQPEAAEGYKLISIANKQQILTLMGLTEDAERLSEESIQFKDLTDIGKAAVFGVRAFALSLFGVKNFQSGIEFYSKARALDKANYQWAFGTAFLSGRLRRTIEGVRTFATEMEEESFRKACELSNWEKAIPIVMLADILFQKGRGYKGKGDGSEDVPKDEALLADAKKYYHKAFEMLPNSSAVLKRCGKAFALMDEEELAETCLKKAIETDPYSSQSFHRLGQLYEFSKTKKNLSLAEEYYTKAVTAGRRRNFYAECDLSRIRKKRDISYDLVGHFERMKIHYKNDDDRTKIIKSKIQDIFNYNANKRASKLASRGGYGRKPRR